MSSDPAPEPTPFVRPAERYGAVGRPMPKWLPYLLIAVGVLAVIPLTMAVYERMNPPVRAELVGWTVDSEFQVTVRVNINKPAEVDASCEVWALDASGERVGTSRAELTGERTSGLVTHQFPTSSGTAAVETGRCIGQDR